MNRKWTSVILASACLICGGATVWAQDSTSTGSTAVAQETGSSATPAPTPTPDPNTPAATTSGTTGMPTIRSLYASDGGSYYGNRFYGNATTPIAGGLVPYGTYNDCACGRGAYQRNFGNELCGADYRLGCGLGYGYIRARGTGPFGGWGTWGGCDGCACGGAYGSSGSISYGIGYGGCGCGYRRVSTFRNSIPRTSCNSCPCLAPVLTPACCSPAPTCSTCISGGSTVVQPGTTVAPIPVPLNNSPTAPAPAPSIPSPPAEPPKPGN